MLTLSDAAVMTKTSSNLDGLSIDGLLREGLNPALPTTQLSWEPPTPGELQGAIPGYTIRRLIGRGGMGAVYEAHQTELDRAVAIKLLPAELSAGESFQARFLREAQTMARLRHPNILSVFEFGQTAGGHLFFSMEYVEGGDLSARLRQNPLQPAECFRLVKQICAALEAAHAAGIIHRDIKPSNILLAPDGSVKVTDFGLAVLIDRPKERLTHTGVAIGTFEYAAPEQASGGAVDHRADIYSVGVLCYELLTGQLPRGVFDPPSKLNPTIPVAIDAVIHTAMQNDPAKRFQSAAALREGLENAEASRSTKHRLAFAIIATVALVAIGFNWRSSISSETPTSQTSGNRIVAWGSRSFEDLTERPSGLDDAISIESGFYHALALKKDGSVVAWGSNQDDRNKVPPGLRDVQVIAAGADHSLALKLDGTVISWGLNSFGQTNVPPGLHSVVAIAGGWRHSVALKQDGSVLAWGDNAWGQLDIPAGATNIIAISAGNAHTLALRRDGSLFAWGDNAHGQAVIPDGLAPVKKIAAGGFHNVVIREDDSFFAWGMSEFRQTNFPAGLKGSMVKAGYRHTVAVLLDGSILCWGENVYGQCDPPHGITNVIALAAGFRDSSALIAVNK